MRSVTQAELELFASPYLDDGYKRDELFLQKARVDTDSIVGVFTVGESFIPSDGVFHFTLLLAFIAVARLAIVYAHLDSGLSRRHGEVLLTHLDLRCTQLITQKDDLEISLTLEEKKEVGPAAFYSGAIDICDGSFKGAGEFYFPLPKKREG